MSAPDVMSRNELCLLAKRLIVENLLGELDWLQWEDVPMLSERAFLALRDAIEVQGKRLFGELQHAEVHGEIDSAHWLSLIRHGRETIDVGVGQQSDSWPEGMEFIRQAREALGLFSGAMPITPQQAWEEALEHMRRLRAEPSA